MQKWDYLIATFASDHAKKEPNGEKYVWDWYDSTGRTGTIEGARLGLEAKIHWAVGEFLKRLGAEGWELVETPGRSSNTTYYRAEDSQTGSYFFKRLRV